MPMEVDYFRMYNLTREPFSSSPDPDFFYQSRQHFGTLQQLENAIRNIAGVNLITGAPGTGKTTLLRHLYRKMSHDNNLDVHLLNAQYCETEQEFEQQILTVFGHFENDPFMNTLHQDMHFDRLIQTIRDSEKKMVILIDDGHLISREALRVINRLADVEVNKEKKLQLVIFANRSLMENVNEYPELKARISHYNVLGPLSFTDTRHMIGHRLKIAGNTIKQIPLFTYPAMVAIYLATGGSPKKIVKLCHRLVLSMSLRKSMKAGWFQVRFCARRVLSKGSLFADMVITSSVFTLVVVAVFMILNSFGDMSITRVGANEQIPIVQEQPEQPIVAEKINRVPPVEVQPEQANPVPELPSETIKVKDTITHQAETLALPTEETTPVEQGHAMPDNLGQVEVKRSDTLLVMLEKVYGHSRSIYSEGAFKANPHIPDLNYLNIGDRIIFPLIDHPITPPGYDAYWVRVASFTSLDKAFDFIRAWPSDALKIKMIPLFREDTGYRIDVVVKQVFKDRAAAQDVCDGISFVPASEKALIQFKLKETRFYSDPFFK